MFLQELHHLWPIRNTNTWLEYIYKLCENKTNNEKTLIYKIYYLYLNCKQLYIPKSVRLSIDFNI